jgi:hypothetical protein
MARAWSWKIWGAVADSIDLIDWFRVLKYFIMTFFLLGLASLIFGLQVLILGVLFLPFWFVIWFLVLYMLGKLNKN